MTTNDNSIDAKPDKPTVVDDALPRVEPPNAGFILQLFFIPMIIVSIIVMVWLMFSWLAHMGTNPSDLVERLEKGDDAAWQRAGILADMLQNPQKQHLRIDKELATKLVEILRNEIDKGGSDKKRVTDNQINLRVYLCRTLGEFHLPLVLPALVEALETERDGSRIEPLSPKGERSLTELDVRRAALEAIAVLSTNIDRKILLENKKLMMALKTASREKGDPGRDEYLRRELRSTAAFVLGVIGGEDALQWLDLVMDDPYANTRFNAATGLARHGDARAVPELVDMLDLKNDDVVVDEKHETGRQFKRSLVISTALEASKALIAKNEEDSLAELRAAIEMLVDADLPRKVREEAKAILESLKERKSLVNSSSSSG